jgi:hypothetical protein
VFENGLPPAIIVPSETPLQMDWTSTRFAIPVNDADLALVINLYLQQAGVDIFAAPAQVSYALCDLWKHHLELQT